MELVTTETVGGYEFFLPEHHLIVQVSSVKAHSSDDRVTGYITILHQGSELNKIYPRTQLNFSSEQTRNRLAKALSEKFPKNPFPWRTILDRISEEVQERARMGEPLLELWTGEDVQPPEYLLSPILFRNLPTVIFGDKGVFKSSLAIVCYLCLTLPWTENPLGFIAPRSKVKTIILDWETDQDIVAYYGSRIQLGHGLPSLPISYRRCSRPLADDIEAIQNHIASVHAEAVIIDSLALAAGGDLNKTEAPTRFFAALRQLKVASIIIAQNSKDQESKRKTIFGSTLFSYNVRNIFELVKANDQTNPVVVSLFHKEHNLTGKTPPMSFEFNFNGKGVTIERRPFDVAEFREKVSLQNQIADALKRGPLTYQAIAEAIGADKPDSVRVTLSSNKRRFVSLGGGLWGLVTS